MALQLRHGDAKGVCVYVVLMLRDGGEGTDLSQPSGVRTENNTQVRRNGLT